MSRRCPGCGAFYDGDECPNQHDEPYTPLPPLIQARYAYTGRVVIYEWKGTTGVFIVVSEPDDTGRVGLAALQENVRAPLDHVEEV